MRLVPVGVDAELFRPLPGGRPRARPADHHGVGRRRPQGPRLPHRGGRQAAHRTRRLADDHRPAEAGQEHGPHRARTASAMPSTFVSGVPDERIVELYAEAELAVVPSLYEGFSLPAIEAMATGTALVATDGGALPEVTGRDGETVLQCRGRRCRRARRRRSAAASTTPSCAPVSATPAGAESSSGGRGGAAPSSPSSSTARSWRCPRTSPRREPNGRRLTCSRSASTGSPSSACRPARLVLDAGAGFGRHAFELARRGYRTVAARPRRRRGGGDAGDVGGDGRDRRGRGQARRRRAARRRHRPAVPRRVLRRRRSRRRCSSTSPTTSARSPSCAACSAVAACSPSPCRRGCRRRSTGCCPTSTTPRRPSADTCGSTRPPS